MAILFSHSFLSILISFPLFLSLDSPPLYMLPHRGGSVLFPHIWLLHSLWHPHVDVILYSYYTPHSTKLGILISPCPSVSPSVCGQNRVHSVSPTILAGSISYLHILSSNFRRCVAYKGFYPAALKGSGVLSSPERAGRRQGRQAPLTLSRPQFFTDHFQTWQGHLLP